MMNLGTWYLPTDILALDKALARWYQHNLARHRRVLENRLQRRKEIIKGKVMKMKNYLMVVIHQ